MANLCVTVAHILEDLVSDLRYCSSRVKVHYNMKRTEYGCVVIIVIKLHNGGKSFYKNTVKLQTRMQLGVFRELCQHILQMCHKLHVVSLI